MKIAVITPVGPGHQDALERCRASVAAQDVPDGVDVLHVVVADGDYGDGSVGELFLPVRANDAGATPRAVGSAYAIGQGADAIAFLDADNEWEPNHLAVALQYIAQGAEVVSSHRLMCEYDTGRVMFHDVADSDGDSFADTNTIVLAGAAVNFAPTWNCWMQGAESGADRVFWGRLVRSFSATRACTMLPTVRYRTPWLVHYSPEFTPPTPSKLVATDDQGRRAAKLVKPVRGWTCVDGEFQADLPEGALVFAAADGVPRFAWEVEGA